MAGEHQIIIPESEFSPLIVFIIICFFSILALIIFKSAKTNLPSVWTAGTQCAMMIASAIVLLAIGTVSVNAEWTVMIVFTLIVLMCIFGAIDPNIFFYPELS